jgi:hypothetical protein
MEAYQILNSSGTEELRAALARAEAAEAERDRLRMALECIGRADPRWLDTLGDDLNIVTMHLQVGDLRRARAALADAPGEGDQPRNE